MSPQVSTFDGDPHQNDDVRSISLHRLPVSNREITDSGAIKWKGEGVKSFNRSQLWTSPFFCSSFSPYSPSHSPLRRIPMTMWCCELMLSQLTEFVLCLLPMLSWFWWTKNCKIYFAGWSVTCVALAEVDPEDLEESKYHLWLPSVQFTVIGFHSWCSRQCHNSNGHVYRPYSLTAPLPFQLRWQPHDCSLCSRHDHDCTRKSTRILDWERVETDKVYYDYNNYAAIIK